MAGSFWAVLLLISDMLLDTGAALHALLNLVCGAFSPVRLSCLVLGEWVPSSSVEKGGGGSRCAFSLKLFIGSCLEAWGDEALKNGIEYVSSMLSRVGLCFISVPNFGLGFSFIGVDKRRNRSAWSTFLSFDFMKLESLSPKTDWLDGKNIGTSSVLWTKERLRGVGGGDAGTPP